MRTPRTPSPQWRALALGLAGLTAASGSQAQVTFYEHDGFRGRSYTTTIPVPDLQRRGFNDRASSAVVTSDRWLICEDSRFEGRCTVLRPGQYPSLAAMGLNDRVSSVRSIGRRAQVDDDRYAPHPEVVGDFRRRDSERLFEAPVSSARAVFGAPAQRCWMEREQVSESRGDARVPGAILGAVIGGILGHQVGAGSGRDIATVGGVVAGAAVGSNIGRNQDGSRQVTRDVQRCADGPRPATPAYWDVTYRFRGQEHQVQLMAAPGPTITVNRLGEPRA
ncbi:exported hypothetical protein [Rubrivivax sp. A210]|uniref:beta/gamma crystallin-related protein n=1 Tax=Rubrivivax sp. A210 TaxID=2772301 RepID=UPI001918999E|nr:beta/gamma crystallin-related protein [Rubrivivax sp. A210]CAD5365928.1 exported hypothetical protein [Rubrivivax sp. A210]